MSPLPGPAHAANAEMTEEDVLRFLDLCEGIGIDVVVDGGWCVDALLGRQTRPHRDLDVALPVGDLPRLRAALEHLGYAEVPHADTSAWQFVLGDDAGHEIDIHGFVHEGDGKGTGVAYASESLQGIGRIAGRVVRCITAEWMVRYHTGYEPDEEDWRDVRALCEAFRLELPGAYGRFQA